MCDAARALLDELMGRNRNADPTEKRKELNWEDPEVNRHMIINLSIHPLTPLVFISSTANTS